MDSEDPRNHLAALDWGTQGLTRNEMRAAWPAMPDALYLHLPDSKRFEGADAVLHEAARSAARAEGEFTAADDTTPTDGAMADGGPPAWGADPLLASRGIVNDGGNTPLPDA